MSPKRERITFPLGPGPQHDKCHLWPGHNPHLIRTVGERGMYVTLICGGGARAELANALWRNCTTTETGCWEFVGNRNSDGYGQVGVGYQILSTHRVAWEATHGLIPDEMHVLHRCDNPPCINPEHLFLGTNLDNVRDKMSKGRHRSGAKLTDAQVASIRARYLPGVSWRAGCGRSAVELAEEYGVTKAYIRQLARREARASVEK